MKTALALGTALLLATARALAATPLPVDFTDDRVFLRVPAPDGGELRLFTDTGGGGSLLSRAAAQRLQLQPQPLSDAGVRAELGADTRQLAAPVDFAAARVPPMPAPVMVVAAMPAFGGVAAIGDDGLLGQNWFANRVWTWDYPHRQLIVQNPGYTPPQANPLPIAFRTANGERVRNFGRIALRVDRQDLPVLFDTGATTVLTTSALMELADSGPRVRATSMITSRVFKQWRRAHPEWKVIDNAQSGTRARMILVPDAGIAGFQVGPLWFTERSEAQFEAALRGATDQPVVGAVGGNAFSGLRVTVDYARSQAWVEGADRAAAEAAARRAAPQQGSLPAP